MNPVFGGDSQRKPGRASGCVSSEGANRSLDNARPGAAPSRATLRCGRENSAGASRKTGLLAGTLDDAIEATWARDTRGAGRQPVSLWDACQSAAAIFSSSVSM